MRLPSSAESSPQSFIRAGGQGWVSGQISGKGGVASPSAINSYELDSVHKARVLIERSVAAEAAVHVDEPTLARLEQSLAIQKQTMRDPVHFLICDREFHLAIYRSCGNPHQSRSSRCPAPSEKLLPMNS